jgi:radical SAM/Cys-rich protein
MSEGNTSPPAAGALRLLPTLARRQDELAAPERQLALLDAVPIEEALAGDFGAHLAHSGQAPLRAEGISTLQLNVGRLCNQTCQHCHVDAGPERTEVMSRAVAERCMEVLARTAISTVDITGGAPEMAPVFRYLVEESRRLGRHVVDRCNLTILTTAPFAHLPRFLADHGVEVVCSLPHYRAPLTDRQRGAGVFERSIAALKLLNELGYGREGSGLRLVLVTNPVGAFLPAGQASLEGEWKREMQRLHGVSFDALYTITNMPISRYLEWLRDAGKLPSYLCSLVQSFNPAAVPGLMCRTLISVGHDGRLFDCDFNQMLDLQVDAAAPRHIDDFDLAALERRRIVTRRHCFGCTAGAGSSCGGQTT